MTIKLASINAAVDLFSAAHKNPSEYVVPALMVLKSLDEQLCTMVRKNLYTVLWSHDPCINLTADENNKGRFFVYTK